MSDAFRKDFSTKAEEKMTPDSSKSTLDKTKESLTGAGDKAARGAQPDSNKSTTQSVGDKFGRSKDEEVHGGSGGSLMDKTKNLFSSDKH
ncbi:Nn.00g051000.m01.CDS01 [Neocucurbitaria sp. VM-36]